MAMAAGNASPPVLVTGASGQVGRELVRRHERYGLAVVGFDHAGLDITDPAAVAAAIDEVQPVCVVNGAAYTAVDRAEEEADKAFAVNAAGPENLARACRRHGIPLLHISTDYVFDGSKRTPYREDDPVAPLGVYGRSKEEGERRLRAITNRHCIIRTSWVFAAHGHNFVTTMLRLGSERPRLRIVDDQHGGPTPAAAIADMLLTLAARCAAGEEPPWGTYHFSGAPSVTWFGFAQEIFAQAAAILGRPAPVLEPITTADYPTPARRPAWSVLDCSKIEKVLGIQPPDWRQGLAAVLTELRATP